MFLLCFKLKSLESTPSGIGPRKCSWLMHRLKQSGVWLVLGGVWFGRVLVPGDCGAGGSVNRWGVTSVAKGHGRRWGQWIGILSLINITRPCMNALT